MINKIASLDLVEFIEKNILPLYASFDKAHGIAHVIRVIRRSIDMATVVGADLNMVYVVAAYHDLGLSGPRAAHHITGGRILESDVRLRQWFSEKQISVMKEAVEDHRASSARMPRSIYGRIVAEADRDLEPSIVIRRTIQFSINAHPDQSINAHWQHLNEHLEAKYSARGYIRLWVNGSENEHHLRELRTLIEDKKRLRDYFDTIYREEREMQKTNKENA